ncbi:MAG: glycosyltransferase family 39 protein, partial [Dehalococcoidia bacterium]|nr:glycosyltransferase family 39 protein [Dehalococcoidia bacterium]
MEPRIFSPRATLDTWAHRLRAIQRHALRYSAPAPRSLCYGQGGARRRAAQTDTANATSGASLRAFAWVARAATQASLREYAVPLAIVLAIACSARLVWVVFSDWQPAFDDDAFRYDFAARALIEGRGYVHLDGAPTAFWPPGYPLLLAAAYAVFGEAVAVAQALNVALATATVALVYLIGRRTVGPRPALVGAGIVALFPSLIFFTAVTLSEVTFTFLALLAVYLLVVDAQGSRERDPSAGSGRSLRLLFAAGLVLGFASLVRGQALLLPVVLIPFWLLAGIQWPRIADKLVVLALGIGLIVAPWTVRNAMELDSPVLISTNAGVDFWIGHNAEAAGNFGRAGGEELVLRYPELETAEREVRVNREGFREGLAYAATHPAQELLLPVKKLFWLYYNDEEGLKWNEGHGGQAFLSSGMREALLSLSNVYYFAVLGLVLLGAPRWFSLRRPGPLLLLSLV